jgi:hypothetical protein
MSLAGVRGHGWAGCPRFGALITSHLSNPLPRANAANGVTGYDQATVIPVGRVGPGTDVEPGRCPMPTPPPRHLPSRPRHLPRSRWPWRLGLVAFGLTTAVLAALVASATLLPQPPLPRRVPGPALPSVPAEPTPRPAPTTTTGPREPTTAPTRSAPTPDTVPRTGSRPTSAAGPATAQAPATAATTTITEAFSTFGTTTQPPVTAPTTAAPTTTVPTTTAAPTTTLATTTSTEPTTGPTTSSAEATTTTGSAIP